MYQREVQRKNEIPFNLIDIILLFFNGASLDQDIFFSMKTFFDIIFTVHPVPTINMYIW